MKGFTLFEMILVVALMAMITSFAPPIFMQLRDRTGFDMAIDTYVSSLHRAQNLSESVKDDSSWGVKVAKDNVTIFKGNSYNSREEEFDEVSPFYFSNFDISNNTEFIFKKMYGVPILFGTTTFSNQFGDIKTVSVNSVGLISF